MNNKRLTWAAIAVLSSALTVGAFAQGPVGDEVKVTFDRPVQVGQQTLPAGDYTVRQVTSASNPRVLEFITQGDNKLVATVTAIPVLQNTPPSETKIILQDEGGGARLSRIWVQGKSYGYGFPGSAMPASQTTTASAQLSGSYAATETATTANRVVETPVAPPAEVPAAATPAPTPTPEPAAPAPQPAADATPAPAPTPDVPATGLGWVDLTALGLAMAATGLWLSRREVRRG